MIKNFLHEVINILSEAKVIKISLQQAEDKKMFGPVYHGTLDEKSKKIDEEGFKIFIGNSMSGDISHGYQAGNYYNGIPAPVHHLGYGIYFTTVKSIAKGYSYDSNAKLKTYYLESNRILEINFGSQSTMMKWWIENGYDPELAKKDRVAATKKLTDSLSSKYDAIWFKGKGLWRLLDGDQICVYNLDIIKELDLNLSQKGEIGSTVIAKEDIKDKYSDKIIPKGTKGIVLNIYDIKPEHRHFHNNEEKWVNVKWKKGGTKQVYASAVEFI